ncbi:aspartic protease, partial [Rhizoctonia solani 123E]
FGYTINVGLGSPPTSYNLVVDTGSSYTWIGSEKYAETSTSIKQGDKRFKSRYASGWVTGAHYKDLLTLSPSLNIPNMEFGVASSIENIDADIDGILLRMSPSSVVKRDNNFEDRSKGDINGRLTFGESDPTSYTGELNWVGIEKQENSEYSQHWSFKQSIKEEYELTPSAQLWPRALSYLISGHPDAHYSVIRSLEDLAVETRTGFVLGHVFMQRFYTAYDASNSKIGFAYTPSTYLTVD